MADQYQTIPMAADLRPIYYDSFHCLAADCRYTCCRGWAVTFDKKDYLRLKQLKCSPELDAKLKGYLRRVKKGPLAEKYYGEFDLREGCMQREDGLCALQLEQGHEALPYVCRMFPRMETRSPSGFLERSLSPACEGVLELLWNLPEGVDFASDLLPEKGAERGTLQVKIVGLLPHFQDIRSRCIDFLQDRRYTLSQRILLMGLALNELVDGERDIPSWLWRVQALADAPETAAVLPALDGTDNLPLFLSNNIKILRKIYNAYSAFAQVPDELCAALGCQYDGDSQLAVDADAYLKARERYRERLGNREYFMENLMAALFFHMNIPRPDSMENLWKSYVQFCNLYSFYRFMAVMSCREGVEDTKAELFRLTVCASRELIHNELRQEELQDTLFQHNSTSLAHMAILLGG